MKKGFWTADWFAGLVITLVFLFAGQAPVLQSLERTAYDWGVRMSSGTPSDRVAVIAIDDESIANLGRWPWPRDLHASMIEILNEGGAKVVGNTVFFLEPQEDPGLIFIDLLADAFNQSSLSGAAAGEAEILSMLVDELSLAAANQESPELQDSVDMLEDFIQQSVLTQSLSAEAEELGTLFNDAADALNTDAILGDSMQSAGNVVLAMPFVLGEPLGNPDQPLPEYVVANALSNVDERIEAIEAGHLPFPSLAAISPIPEVGIPAAAIGHLNANPDVDGGIRSEPLVVRYFDEYYPSLSLQLAAQSLNISMDDIEIRLGDGVRLKNLYIRTDPVLQMQTFFYGDDGDKPAFSVDSFFDVIEGKVPAEKFKDRIVLIGATATGVGTPQVTPIASGMHPVLTLAHSVSSILNEDFFVKPRWAHWAELGVLLVVAVYLIVLLPKLRAGIAFGISLVLLVVLLSVHLGLMTTQRMWLELMLPATLLFLGHLLLTTKRFLMTERGKLKSEAESAESNRMLGLAYQGKGDLDQAFASFRKVPMDESVMDLLYNLALDFERKRQHNKAGAVYTHMADYDPNFRDLQQRMNRSKKLEETVMLGGAGASTAGGTLMLDGDDIQKPMLGRYQVEKELGKGAMGIVYLGRDPKINRVVAIKTMALSQEFEEDELDEVKERFFREAETAGRLNHPNIVTVFDAGEEHDLAYIAMEFLSGADLAAYTKADNLLPLEKVLEITALSADALATAHVQNVVHRDIKPANIMYDPDNGQVKLTDFGIARITDASKTKTGMVLGTPSYMSPEQLSGKKVDGRSDLFSLGVMLYQMTSGTLPFKGDSMATLMFKIANEEHPDVLEIRSDLPPAVKNIIDKALQKNADERYQSGTDMAREIRECMASL